jgi:hypothetical protein
MSILKNGHFVRAFFVFHLSVGTRLAIRKLAAVLGIAFAVYYLLWPQLFHSLFASLIQAKSLMTGFLSAVISISIAGMAAPRVFHGLDGWIRHLPSSSLIQRRMAIFAVFVAQLPVLIVLAVLSIFACRIYGFLPATYLVGLPLLGLASAQCVAPVKRKLITRPLAFIASVLSPSGHWWLIFGSFILLITTDLISGPLSPTPRASRLHKALQGSWLNMTISWRALRLRLSIPYFLSLLVLGLTLLFLLNNTVDPSLALKAVRFGGALSIALLYGTMANTLATRRPPWLWARSLPWSAKKRIFIDSFFLSLHTIPLLILLGLMNLKALWPLIISLPVFTFFALQTMRRALEDRMGASGKIFLAGMLGALSINLLPFISFLFFALTPLASKYAVKEEQSQKVSRWLELHHLAAGDSLSWKK